MPKKKPFKLGWVLNFLVYIEKKNECRKKTIFYFIKMLILTILCAFKHYDLVVDEPHLSWCSWQHVYFIIDLVGRCVGKKHNAWILCK
jgi:hypothetical protein